MKNKSGERGLIKMIIVVVIALLILSFYGFNLRNLVNSPTTQDNFSYVATETVGIWNEYLKAPAEYIWNVFISYVWDPAIQHLETVNMPTTTPAGQ